VGSAVRARLGQKAAALARLLAAQAFRNPRPSLGCGLYVIFATDQLVYRRAVVIN
jgi:hypothetical protein